MDGEQLWDIIEGMKANGLLEYSHLVTGVCKHAPLHSHVNLMYQICPTYRSSDALGSRGVQSQYRGWLASFCMAIHILSWI